MANEILPIGPDDEYMALAAAVAIVRSTKPLFGESHEDFGGYLVVTSVVNYLYKRIERKPVNMLFAGENVNRVLRAAGHRE